MNRPQHITLSIDGMSCASCVGRVEDALSAVDGVAEATVNLAVESATLSLDDASRLAEVAQTLDKLGYPARTASTTLSIASMSCASCVGRVEDALAATPGVVSVAVNLASETARVEFLQGVVSAPDLQAASAAVGYPAEVLQAQTDASRVARKEHEALVLSRRVLMAALLALPVFILEMGTHVSASFHEFIDNTIGRQASWLIQCALTTMVLFGPGRQLFLKGIPALLRAAPDMNSLVAIGAGAAWGYSLVATFQPAWLPDGVRAVYFEAAAVIVVLILIGRWMEARAKGRTGAAIQALLRLQPATASVVRGSEVIAIDVDALAVGDLVRVRPGERIAVDGEVTDGSGHVDESMMTGESVPVAKRAGSPVTGGTINGTGSLTFRVTRVGADTTLAQIVKMVEDAQGARLPIQAVVDRVTRWFVPAVMLVAAITVIAWLMFGPDPALTLALVAGVSVLIIACPCAMGLATPTSIMVGTGRAAEMGVLFRKGDALQTLSDVDMIALDKTGTLTQGQPTLTDLQVAPGVDRRYLLSLVAAVEQRSEHPVATAIVQGAISEGITIPVAADFRSITGLGVAATVDGRRLLVGADRLMVREGIDTTPMAATVQTLASRGHSVMYAAINGELAGVIAVADALKPTSVAAVNALQQRGYSVAMITGDKRETAEAIAREAGIDQVIAEVLPDGKVAALDELRGQGRKVAFVGDGINDAPALAHADAGIAIGTGTDVAIESAEVVLMSGDLNGVVNAVELSARTLANIRQNLGWAFAYNIALIPVAAGVLYPVFGMLLSPMFAAAAMALSSVSVVVNALRLQRVKPVVPHGTMQPMERES